MAEWNLNLSDNVELLGNYRFRPALLGSGTYSVIKNIYETTDIDSAYGNPEYTGATDSRTILITGIDPNTLQTTIAANVDKSEQMLYSLTDVIARFRPRSNINKVRYFGHNQYLNYPNSDMFNRPRFYLASKDDKFKYWTSYRVDSDTYGGITRGMSETATGNGDYYIDDAAPFVVYKDAVPANRIVVKMQTGVGTIDKGPFQKSNNESFDDPFYESSTRTGVLPSYPLINQKTPVVWKVQVLDASNNWNNAISFTKESIRANGKRIIGADGYIELAYGISNIPSSHSSNFRLLGEYTSQAALPVGAEEGDAYLVPTDTGSGAYPQGTIYVWNGTNWTTDKFYPTYAWYLHEEDVNTSTAKATSLTSPQFYGTLSGTTNADMWNANYREFKFIKGIRIVVSTMSQPNSTFDLIEMSPRLVADLSDKTTEYSVEKIGSDIGNTGIPVGQLLASTGSLGIFDYDESFNEYNDLKISNGSVVGSLVSNLSSKNLQIKLYEHLVDDRLKYGTKLLHYFVPIKTMYVDGFPKISKTDRKVTLQLRDLLFHFESIIAPSLLLRNVSLSYAISILLDSIGFSNYKFYKNADEPEDQIPYFFITKDVNVADILNDLAQSTQTAMFFDENNNFVTMSKNYIMPTETQRKTATILHGTKDYYDAGIESNKAALVDNALANIKDIETEENTVFNGGKVTYINKYIQKSYSTIQEAGMLNSGKAYKYKPVLLWEVAGTEALRPTNEEVTSQSSYALSALVLNSEITDELPTTGNYKTCTATYIKGDGEVLTITGDNNFYPGEEISVTSGSWGYSEKFIVSYSDSKRFAAFSDLVIDQSIASTIMTSNTREISNNIIDVGQSIYWLTRYKGYFYANSEIIKYDAVEHSVAGVGNVWITDITEYQKYFAKLPFNGRMYPTGKIRIYSEPKYGTDGKPIYGAVAKHGRMQFGTGIRDASVEPNIMKPNKHTVLDDKLVGWLDPQFAKSFSMESDYLFKNDHKYGQTIYTMTVATDSSGKTFTVADTTDLRVGTMFYPYVAKNIAVGANIDTTTTPGVMKVTTTTAHGFVPGNTITIALVVPTTYRGNYTILSVPTATSFTVTNTNGASGNVSTAGIVQLRYSGNYSNSKIKAGTTIASLTLPTGTPANQVTLSIAPSSTINEAATLYVTDKLIEPVTHNMPLSVVDNIPFLTDKPKVEGTIKNFLNESIYPESSKSTVSGDNKTNAQIKSSALTITGPTNVNSDKQAKIIAYDPNTATYTTETDHTFVVDDKVIITGMSPASGANGTFPIQSITSTTFVAGVTAVATATTGEYGNAIRYVSITERSNVLSYVYKDYSDVVPNAHSFGTRMRIVGKPMPSNDAINAAKQLPVGAEFLRTITQTNGTSYDVAGTGGGIAINLNTTSNRNIGYYFEIVALTNDAIIDESTSTKTVDTIPNVFFYKIERGTNSKKAIPITLWSGNAPILVDDGLFVGMSKAANTKNPTVYDLSIETEELPSQNGLFVRKFYLYLNGKLIQVVQDDDAIPVTNDSKKLALFVRGQGMALFENLYVIGDRESKSTNPLEIKSVFNEEKLNSHNYRKYLANPSMLQTYLQNVGSNHQPWYSLYYEEFGTVLRECAHFDIRYDKAYPALYSKISPTFNDSQGYVVSNFRSNPYGAEFLIFNATDFALNLDESTGNYLRIQGVTFTQQSTHDLTVDEYFNRNSSINNYDNYSELNNKYMTIQNSINTYGKKEFSLAGNYIQNLDTANNLMAWMVDKAMKPRKSVGVTIFADPRIQLGDIVEIKYSIDGILQNSTSRFLVYHIKYERSGEGPSMSLYLSEVV